MKDIRTIGPVDILTDDSTGDVRAWVHVDGQCVLRVQGASRVVISNIRTDSAWSIGEQEQSNPPRATNA